MPALHECVQYRNLASQARQMVPNSSLVCPFGPDCGLSIRNDGRHLAITGDCLEEMTLSPRDQALKQLYPIVMMRGDPLDSTRSGKYLCRDLARYHGDISADIRIPQLTLEIGVYHDRLTCYIDRSRSTRYEASFSAPLRWVVGIEQRHRNPIYDNDLAYVQVRNFVDTFVRAKGKVVINHKDLARRTVRGETYKEGKLIESFDLEKKRD